MRVSILNEKRERAIRIAEAKVRLAKAKLELEKAKVTLYERNEKLSESRSLNEVYKRNHLQEENTRNYFKLVLPIILKMDKEFTFDAIWAENEKIIKKNLKNQDLIKSVDENDGNYFEKGTLESFTDAAIQSSLTTPKNAHNQNKDGSVNGIETLQHILVDFIRVYNLHGIIPLCT